METNPENVIRIAHDAGEEIMKIYEDPNRLEVVSKEDNSPLNKADLAAHETIQNGLLRLDSSTPIVSEEGRVGNPLRSEYAWLVDPLDGTKEFIK